MARTKILVPPEKQCGYTSVIVSYSTGIDSTGAIYWATQNFAPEKIFLLYCDTGAEYSVNEALFFNTAKVLGLKPSLNVIGCARCWTTKKARCLSLENVWG
jgi:3'-phosphoadenosine 5'-phosphosulfate sulfotransferase (PAPS reductase)/FAD synthetase